MKNNININLFGPDVPRTFLTLTPGCPGVKSFSPPPWPQEDALFGADVHDLRRGPTWPVGLLKNLVQKKFVLIFWPVPRLSCVCPPGSFWEVCMASLGLCARSTCNHLLVLRHEGLTMTVHAIDRVVLEFFFSFSLSLTHTLKRKLHQAHDHQHIYFAFAPQVADRDWVLSSGWSAYDICIIPSNRQWLWRVMSLLIVDLSTLFWNGFDAVCHAFTTNTWDSFLLNQLRFEKGFQMVSVATLSAQSP